MKVLKRIISCIIVVSLLFVTLFCATNLFQKKESNIKYHQFFEYSTEFDVLFLGTSHTIYAIYPMELWNDYGITSYNLGSHSARIPTTYWILKNALDYAKPKVVVLDCFWICQEQKTSDYYSLVHTSLDAFPLSKNKIEAIKDLLDDNAIARRIDIGMITEEEKRTPIGLLWNYSVYHSRWEEINKDDFVVVESNEYGAEAGLQIAKTKSLPENNGNTIEKNTVGIEYLKKIIELCKENNIEIILTYLPYPFEERTGWEEINTTYQIAKEYGIDYVDLMSLDLVDYNTDCYDSDSHINLSGALKITNYLGKYLKENYNLQNHHNDSNYEHWENDYVEYENNKNTQLASIDDLNTYLMALSDKNYGYIISIDDSSIFNDDITMEILKNKGVKVEEINEDTRYIMVCGKDTQVINSYINNWGDYGNFTIYFNENDTYGAYTDEELFVLSSKSLAKINDSIYISVFDMDDRHNIIDVSLFAKPKLNNNNTLSESEAVRIH